MPSSMIQVYTSSGSPASGRTVVLSFSTGGVTRSVRTDRNGKAVVCHDRTGQAKVIVDGTTRGTIRAPDSIVVKL